ncbi:MAG: hypothetical protein JO284_07445 [Planctomycetaceae bacterium]|nr:hypothetical protein [Planctomycetaceae bacterium]
MLLGMAMIDPDTSADDLIPGRLKCFQKAVKSCRDLLKQALLGQAEALAELGRDDEALACLMKVYSLALHDGKSGREDILERMKTVWRSR